MLWSFLFDIWSMYQEKTTHYETGSRPPSKRENFTKHQESQQSLQENQSELYFGSNIHKSIGLS